MPWPSSLSPYFFCFVFNVLAISEPIWDFCNFMFFLCVCGLLLVQHFRFFLHFVQSKMNCSETERKKLFSLCFSVYFFPSSPCPRRNCIMGWNLQDWHASPVSLSLGNTYFAASLKLINGVWEVFLFVTKPNILLNFCFVGSQWARANSYIQNCSYYRVSLA